MVQLKFAVPVLIPSVAETVTVYGLLELSPTSMVPEITPVVGSIERPAGRPEAL